jgi:hypothetical protein
MTGKLHDADLVLIEGDGYNVYCDYAPVEGKRSDIVKRMLQVAKSPYKTYRVLANKLSCDDETRKNKAFPFEIIEKTEMSLKELIND